MGCMAAMSSDTSSIDCKHAESSRACGLPAEVHGVPVHQTRMAPDHTWQLLCAGKFAVLEALLSCMVGELGERVVVCSSSTQLLDEAASLCASHAWTTARVDGSVMAHKRADIVHAFNTAGIGQVLPQCLSMPETGLLWLRGRSS